jgi:hypothetical protein
MSKRKEKKFAAENVAWLRSLLQNEWGDGWMDFCRECYAAEKFAAENVTRRRRCERIAAECVEVSEIIFCRMRVDGWGKVCDSYKIFLD